VLVLNLALSSVNDKSRLTFVLAAVYTATDFKSYQISKNLLILPGVNGPILIQTGNMYTQI